ncbi:lipocalin family protein [Psychrobacter sp.]|uniref:lipocalin family protein n=1 Tax=Psychrobacter sp. TaxID=56811 RepID=UPI0025F21F8E|nr:lipocalin family protein [Psychrobacter sp.]
MSALLKHTGIALVLLVTLAAYSTISHAEIGVERSQTLTKNIIYNDQIVTKPTSVQYVNLNKYAGRWYEIARLPMYFQRKCASDVTATYNLNKDIAGKVTSIDVVNECRKQDGSMIMAQGLAKPANNTGSQLKVSFLPSWIRWLPFGKSNYWVLQLDSDYQNALVGTPDNKYLWLLSRKPTMAQSTFEKYKNTAKMQGYDLSKLQVTTHTSIPKTIVDDVDYSK